MPAVSNPVKVVLRNRIKAILKTKSLKERALQSASITQKIFSMKAYQNARRVSIYLSTNTEVCTKALLLDMFERKIEVFVPTYSGKNMKMVKIKDLQDFENLPLTKWNIKQPRSDELREDANQTGGLDLILTPGVAFTINGGRLGHGMGYYDKYIRTNFERNQIKLNDDDDNNQNIKRMPMLVGLAFKEQIVHELPLDEHDVILDAVITSD